MQLRLKLILAFFLLAVVPLASICLYSYQSSLRALKLAAETESQALASDMKARLDTVSRDVNTRLERVARLPLQRVTMQKRQELNDAAQEIAKQVIAEIGETAPYLNSLQYTPASSPDSGSSGKPATGRVDSATANDLLQKLMKSATEMSKVAQQQAKLVPPQSRRGGRPPGDFPPPDRFSAQDRPEIPSPRSSNLLLGRQFNAEIQENGRVVGTIRAQVSSQQILHDVLRRTQRRQGEIPFAVDPDGTLYTAEPEDLAKIDGLPLPGVERKQASQTQIQTPQDWVFSTRKDDPSGVTFGIARPIGAGLTTLRMTAVKNLGYGLAIAALAIVGIIPLSGRMTRNLGILTKSVDRLASGDLTVRVPVTARDEFGKLAKAFNHMASELHENEKRLVEQERFAKEIELCRRIQQEFLPKEVLRLGSIETWGISTPAREVGGDFFNYFVFGGSLALLIGDVSGKGLPAALLMANLQATIKARLPLESDLGKLSAELDEEIESSTPPELYLTLFIAILDRKSSVLRYVNAGHNPQILLRQNGSIERLESTGRPLGLLPGAGYRESRLDMSRGDALFLYTDGLVETENDKGQEFGMTPLERLLVEKTSRPFENLLESVQQEVDTYRGPVEPADDSTMVLVRMT